MKYLTLIFVILTPSMFSSSASANCFGLTGCEEMVCRDSKFVNDIGGGDIGCNKGSAQDSGIHYSLIFSPDLGELRPIWGAPEIMSTLLMMESQPGLGPVERARFQQLMLSKPRMETFLDDRVQSGVTYSELVDSSSMPRGEGMTVHYMVVFTVVQIDRSTIEINLDSSEISPDTNFTTAHSVTVTARNSGRASHDYEVVRIIQNPAESLKT